MSSSLKQAKQLPENIDTNTVAPSNSDLSEFVQCEYLHCTFETIVVRKLSKNNYGFRLVLHPETNIPLAEVADKIQYVTPDGPKLYSGAGVLCVGGKNVVCQSGSKVK